VGTVKYVLEPGGPPRLVARWRGDFREFTLSLDDAVLVSASDAAALAAEARGELPDGRKLRVSLRARRLYVLVAGTPLVEIGDDPRSVLRRACGLLYALSAFSALAAVVVMTTGERVLRNFGLGWPTIVTAVVVAGLACIAQTRLSKAALGIALALYVVDGIAAIARAIEMSGMTSSVGVGFVIKASFVSAMARGLGAIDALRAQAAAKSG
jgi:hypothetical protein